MVIDGVVDSEVLVTENASTIASTPIPRSRPEGGNYIDDDFDSGDDYDEEDDSADSDYVLEEDAYGGNWVDDEDWEIAERGMCC